MKSNVIVDTTILSNFALINREDILVSVFEDALFTSEAVFREFKQCEVRGILPKMDLNWISVIKVKSEEEQHIFELLCQRFGTGEASCLSLALNRNLRILTDDLDARRYAQRMGIPVSGTIGVLVTAIKKDIIKLEEGNHLLTRMIEKGYYSPYNKLNEFV